MRLDEKFLKEVERFVNESTYSNKTEAFKAGMRKLMDEWETKRAIQMLRQSRDWAKKKGIKEPTPEEFAKIREEVGNRSLREAGLL